MRARSQHHEDDDHAPNCEERVADGVGDGVAEGGNLALRGLLDGAERGGRCARPGNRAEKHAGVHAKDVFSHKDAEEQRDLVTKTPAMKRLSPLDMSPPMKAGPVLMPTTAMKVLRPMLLNTHTAGLGMRPKVRCVERNHPHTRPAMSAPPLVLRLRGMPPK